MRQTFTLLLSLSLCCQQGFSQRDTIHLKTERRTITVTDRAPQAFYGELWGKGLLFSANYDRRFSKRLDGLGFGIGAGYIKIDNVSLFSLPVGLNYLLGQNGKYFEVGAGATYLSASLSDFDNATQHGSTVIGTMTFGYRSQPVHSGFMFRAGINPIFFKNTFVPYWPYVSFGYSF